MISWVTTSLDRKVLGVQVLGATTHDAIGPRSCGKGVAIHSQVSSDEGRIRTIVYDRSGAHGNYASLGDRPIAME